MNQDEPELKEIVKAKLLKELSKLGCLEELSKLKYPEIFLSVIEMLSPSTIQNAGEKEPIYHRYQKRLRRLEISRHVPYCLVKFGLISKDSDISQDATIMNTAFQDFIDMGFN